MLPKWLLPHLGVLPEFKIKAMFQHAPGLDAKLSGFRRANEESRARASERKAKTKIPKL